MSPISRFALFLISAGGAASLALAPIAAAADPPLPEPGSENAQDTLNDLKDGGYNVEINWVNGEPGETLDPGFLRQCWVNNINTADASGSLPIVYVDIECPR